MGMQKEVSPSYGFVDRRARKGELFCLERKQHKQFLINVGGGGVGHAGIEGDFMGGRNCFSSQGFCGKKVFETTWRGAAHEGGADGYGRGRLRQNSRNKQVRVKLGKKLQNQGSGGKLG